MAALILADTDIADLRCLTALDELDFLEVDGTAVTDLTPLGEMQQIKFLNIERTNVDDITPLACLPDLDALLLSGTSVSAQAMTVLQDALPHCDIVKDY